MYVSGVRVPFWSPGGSALRTNVAGRIENRVSPAESAFSACIGSGSSSLPGQRATMRCIPRSSIYNVVGASVSEPLPR